MKKDFAWKAEQYAGIFTQIPFKIPTVGVPDGPMFGNGDIGIVAGRGTEDITFWIAKNDLWYAHDTFHYGYCDNGMKGFATLRLDSWILRDSKEGNAADQVTFSAKQKIGTADVEIDLQSREYHLHVTAYVPYQQSVILVKVEAKKGDIPLHIAFAPLVDDDADYSHWSKENDISITKDYHRNAVWETKAAGFCRVVGWKHTENFLREGEQVLVAASVRTNHDTPEYLSEVKEDIDALTVESMTQMRRAHEEWWRSFWDSSGISIPDEPEIEQFWYGSHYLMACCSKAGKFPPGIFGNWITTNHPNWKSDYHLNYNYEAAWWGVFSSNKVGLAAPYDQPVLDYILQAKVNAKERLGCRGVYSHVGIGPKGLQCYRMYREDGTEMIETPYLGQKSNASYAAVNMVMRFYSTWDREYADSCAYPYLRELADFWEDYLQYEDGRYVIYNDCIHEIDMKYWDLLDEKPEVIVDHRDDFNPILSLGLVRMIFGALLDIAKYLGVDTDRYEKWEHILTHISSFPTQMREGKLVFRYTERGRDWCESNSLGIQHIYPCGQIGLSADDELLQIARDTITSLWRWEDNNAFPTFFTAAARVGYDPEIIIENMKKQFLGHSFSNLFVHFGGGGIECCSAVPSCINEMLFQSHEGILRLFPVWKKEKNAAFYQLRGYGAFLVSAEYKKGVVENVVLVSEKGRPCSILCPWENGMEVLKDGVPVVCETKKIREGIVYSFDTEAGAEYRLVK